MTGTARPPLGLGPGQGWLCRIHTGALSEEMQTEGMPHDPDWNSRVSQENGASVASAAPTGMGRWGRRGATRRQVFSTK